MKTEQASKAQAILNELRKRNAVIVIVANGGKIGATFIYGNGQRVTGKGDTVKDALHNLYQNAP